MDLATYQAQFKPDDAVGWLSIDAALNSIYHGVEPRHYAPPIHYRLGGSDPIDGTSIYDNHTQLFHRHLLTYGMSSLYYSEESVGGDFSNWGFEFTFRLAPFLQDADAEARNGQIAKNEPYWAMAVMNNLARYVFESKRWFEAYHFIPANGPFA